MTTQTTFEYDQAWAIDSVNDVLTSLRCDLTNLDQLVFIVQEGEGINGADLEDDQPEAYECWENIQNEVYERLTDNGVICEAFCEEFPEESDELGDYIDDQIELMLSEMD